MTRYLKDHANGTVNTLSLLHSLASEAIPFKEITHALRTWMYEPGVPVLFINWTETTVLIRQERFKHSILNQSLLYPTAEIQKSPCWYVPLDILLISTHSSFSTTRLVLDVLTNTFKIPESHKIAYANLDRMGLLRVAYPSAHYDWLLPAVRDGIVKMSVMDVTGLFSDMVSLGMAGYIPLNDMLSCFVLLDTHIVDTLGFWSVAVEELQRLVFATRGLSLYSKFESLLHTKLTRILTVFDYFVNTYYNHVDSSIRLSYCRDSRMRPSIGCINRTSCHCPARSFII